MSVFTDQKPLVKNLLVIEDEINNADLLAEIFASYTSYRATIIHRAEEALQLLEQHNFDLITLDMLLPGMNGYQFLDVLEQRREAVPVVVVTAMSKLNPLPTYPYIEAVVYKPFDLDVLLETVAASLERSQSSLDKSQQRLHNSYSKLEQTQHRLQQSLRRLNDPDNKL